MRTKRKVQPLLPGHELYPKLINIDAKPIHGRCTPPMTHNEDVSNAQHETIENFSIKEYGQTLMQEDGTVSDIGTPATAIAIQNSGVVPTSLSLEGQPITMDQLVDETEDIESTLHESWSALSLLDDIDRSDDSLRTKLLARNDALESCNAFPVPYGLESISEVLQVFRTKQMETESNSQLRSKITRRSGKKTWVNSKSSKSLDEKVAAAAAAARHAKKLKRRKKKELTALPQLDKLEKRHLEDAQVVKTDVDSNDLTKAAGAWIGLRDYGQRSGDKKGDWTVTRGSDISQQFGPSVPIDPRWNDEVKRCVADGWKYIQNNLGKALVFSDRDGRVFSIKPTQPRNGWDDITTGVVAAFNTVARSINLAEYTRHKRGPFACVSMGVSYGGGQTHPMFLSHNEKVAAALEVFRTNESVIKYAHHVATVFRQWFPRLATVYTLTQMRNLITQDLSKSLFPGIPFDAASLNCTPNTASDWHRDYKNLVWGLCCIGVFGTFDWTISAQLMLEEARTIVELRPGDMIFIPSSTIRHRNAPIAMPEREQRYSFVFYSAGNLFSWVANGDMSSKSAGNISEKQKSTTSRRWSEGWALLPTLRELGVDSK